MQVGSTFEILSLFQILSHMPLVLYPFPKTDWLPNQEENVNWAEVMQINVI
jgi:hypothetical protein